MGPMCVIAIFCFFSIFCCAVTSEYFYLPSLLKTFEVRKFDCHKLKSPFSCVYHTAFGKVFEITLILTQIGHFLSYLMYDIDNTLFDYSGLVYSDLQFRVQFMVTNASTIQLNACTRRVENTQFIWYSSRNYLPLIKIRVTQGRQRIRMKVKSKLYRTEIWMCGIIPEGNVFEE